MTEFKIGEISLQCEKCGSSEFRIPDDANDDSEIICNGCGQVVGTVADVNAEVLRAGRGLVPEIGKGFQDALKGVKSFKPRKID